MAANRPTMSSLGGTQKTSTKKVVLDYQPRSQFLPFHNRTERFAIIIAHRRAGKTVGCINDLIRRAVETDRPDARFAYIAPYYAQAKDVAWQYLKHYAAPLLADTPNESELRVDLVNGARIRLYGSDNSQRLRGLGFDGLVLDEFADFAPGVWSEVLRPALSDRQGFAVFIGTPHGKNELWELFQIAKGSNAWFKLELKASETGLIPQEELDAAGEAMTKDQFAQEFECSFDSAITGAFYAEALERMRDEKRIGRVPIERALPVSTAWDLGISDSTAIWFVQRLGKEVRLIDYEEHSGVGLDFYAELLGKKGYIYDKHYAPHDIAVRELATGQSRVDTLSGLGIEVEVGLQSNVLDGINSVRRLLDSCWIDETRCARGLEALKAYRREFDDRLKTWKQRPRHGWESHGADALRTYATGYEPKSKSAKLKARRWSPRMQGDWMAS
jgi:phage terminase large subunit